MTKCYLCETHEATTQHHEKHICNLCCKVITVFEIFTKEQLIELADELRRRKFNREIIEQEKVMKLGGRR